jgi:diguanylate cyclase (GGDEF)-like protein/PAS domain S-box-containing protein
VASVSDTTIQLHEELQANERRYRTFFENAGIGIAHTDLKGRFVLVNPKFCDITEYSAEELLSLGLHDLLHPEDLAASLEYDAGLADRTLSPHPVERRYMRKRGEVFWGNTTTSLARDSLRQPSFFIHALHDMSERKRMETALRDAEQRYRVIFENSLAGVFAVNIAGRVLSANPALARMLGYESGRALAEEVTGVREFYVDASASTQFHELLFAQKTVENFETRWSRKDGGVICVSLSARMVDDLTNGAISHIVMAEDVTERVRLGNALKEREAGLRHAQFMAKLGHVTTAADGSIESWSESFPQLLGIEAAAMPKTMREWLTRVHADDRAIFRLAVIDAGLRRKGVELEYRVQRPDASVIHVRQTTEPIDEASANEDTSRWFSTLQDISEQKRAEEKITRLNRVYAVLSGINALIVRVRNRDELFREACRIAVEDGKFPLAWIGVLHAGEKRINPIAWAGNADGYLERMPTSVDAALRNGRGMGGLAFRERKAMVANDLANDPRVLIKREALERGFRSLIVLPLIAEEEIVGLLTLYADQVGFFDDEEVKLLLELAGDVSFALEHIKKDEKLNYLANYDAPTGLANRNLLHERLTQQLLTAERAQSTVAVLLLDLERFRTINDTFGRQVGDLLLKQVAERIVRAAPNANAAARVAVDQFALVVPDVRHEDDVARLIDERGRACFGEPFALGEVQLRVAAKVGVALYPNDGSDADTLLKHAEAALKKAKQGGHRYLFYAQEMTERVAEKLALENKLRLALANNEFVLHYQPKIHFQTRKIVGVEALIRWQSPELGLVPPLQFIPLLEETGLILQVGTWALRRAALDHRSWTEQGLSAPRVAVNVSPIQLRQRDFVSVLKSAIGEGVTPAGIDLELTESLIMEDIHRDAGKLNAVRELGVDLAIDDFGTGYSSLGYLAKLPVQTLKIDRSFVRSMQDDPNAMTLVSTIISLAHSLRLTVVAEGVETEEQANYLRLLRCDQMQGYLFSKPLPMEALVSLLRKGSGI